MKSANAGRYCVSKPRGNDWESFITHAREESEEQVNNMRRKSAKYVIVAAW